MIKRSIACDTCGTVEAEKGQNEGWPGWGAVHGIALDGVPNPSLCPTCLARVAEFVDGMKGGS